MVVCNLWGFFWGGFWGLLFRSALFVTQRRSNRIYSQGHFLWSGLLAAFLSVASVATIMAAPLQLPAIVEPASQEHHVGKVIFVELVTPDLAAAKQFYAGLFGWSFSDSRPGTTGFAEASLDGRPVAALVQKKMRGDEK